MIYLEGVSCGCCGARIDMKAAENGFVRCLHCGYELMLPRDENPAALSFLRQGEHDLDTCKFDDAYTAYLKAAELDPEEPEAYFGMALATFRVQYLKDEASETPRMQPVCHEISDRFFSEDKNYLHALEIATVEQRRVYRRRAQEIDNIREAMTDLKNSGPSYDCFLCVKVTNENGGKTEDCERANDIYYHLKDLGYRPFFSEREMKNRTGADYEALILYALYTSECMILVCSNEEYLQTKWVKNEYTRFSKMIADEEKEKDAITFAYYGTPIEKLPTRSGKIQSVDLSKPDAYSRLEQFVKSHTPEARKRREEEMQAKQREEQARESELRELKEKLQRIEEERASAAAPAAGSAALPHAGEEAPKQPPTDLAQFEIKNGVIQKFIGKGGDVVIPDGVTAIGNTAFFYCTALTSVTIPNSVTMIGELAFKGCSSLSGITIPQSVTAIGDGAFLDCDYLQQVTMPKRFAGFINGKLKSMFGGNYEKIPFKLPNKIVGFLNNNLQKIFGARYQKIQFIFTN